MNQIKQRRAQPTNTVVAPDENHLDVDDENYNDQELAISLRDDKAAEIAELTELERLDPGLIWFDSDFEPRQHNLVLDVGDGEIIDLDMD